MPNVKLLNAPGKEKYFLAPFVEMTEAVKLKKKKNKETTKGREWLYCTGVDLHSAMQLIRVSSASLIFLCLSTKAPLNSAI